MADAAGLGRITVFSALGQPLRAEIELNANSDELRGMAAKIASPESFRQAGLEYASALTAVKVSLDKRPTGQPVIRLSSDRPVSDPFIDLLLELNWASGRLVREYTFLLDPPDLSREVATSAPTAAPPAAEMPVAKPAEMPVAKAPEKVSAAPETEPAADSAEKVPAKSVAAEEKTLAQEEAPVTERQVKSGDTLSKIAREVKPEGVTLEQVLVSLFRANPEAFQGSNMNRLKSGKILTIPGKEALESVSDSAARKEFVAHAQDWNAYRSKLAGVTAQEPATEKPAQTEVAGKITAKVEDKVAKPVDTKDQVKVSKTQTPGAQPPAVTKAAAEEEKIAREKALKESAERAAQLEKNVADLQKMAELKNKQLALAQAAAKPAAPAVKPTEPAAPATSTTLPVAPAAVSAVAATTPAKAEGAKPEAEKMPTAPKPKPKAPPPAPVEEDEGLGIAVWGGLAALIAGIGGLVFYRRRKAAPAEEVPFVSPSLGEPSLGANSVFRATGGQSIDTSAASPAVTDFSQTGPGTIDTDEVDPVAEAEVYMAYGRDAQAEEILLEALQKDSKRLAIHLKLLEIYSQRKSAKQFETLATELYAQTGGNGPEWDKAVAMGSKLDPANPLYAAGGSAAPSPFAAAPVAAAAAGFDPDATVVVSSGSKSAPAAPAAPPADSAMSFDLNVGDLPQFGEAPATPSFTPGDTQIKGAPKADQMSAGGNDLALDFDLDLGNSNIAPPAAPDQNVEIGSGGLDFDLKLGDSQVAPHLDDAPGNRADLSAINLDLGQSTDTGMMDLESTMLAVPGSMDSMATNILGGVGGGAGGGNALEQAVATKLDLAKAYEEMGDAEGARDLLQEALAEGTDAQKATAGAMLAKLG